MLVICGDDIFEILKGQDRLITKDSIMWFVCCDNTTEKVTNPTDLKKAKTD